MPLRIDGELIREAKASGSVFHRSIAQQVEHWASLGRVLESVLTVSSVAKVKKLNRPVDLERALAGARSAAGRKKTLALLARKKGPPGRGGWLQRPAHLYRLGQPGPGGSPGRPPGCQWRPSGACGQDRRSLSTLAGKPRPGRGVRCLG